MPEETTFSYAHRSGTWLWQCGVVLPDGRPIEYPICPFCTTSPFREFNGELDLPGRCPECGATLTLEDYAELRKATGIEGTSVKGALRDE